MNFITGKHLPRRTFLRTTSAAMALPFLDAMVPAGRAWRDPMQQASATRLVCIEEAMGCAGGSDWGDAQNLFAPAKAGRDFEIIPSSQLVPLEPYRDYLTVISNTDCRMGMPWVAQEIGGDHDRTTCIFLTQAHPKQTQGADIYLGTSLDQIHAQRFGQQTALPSLQITTEGIDRGGGCAYNYHCFYTTAVSWASPTQPLPATLEPRAVFEQLFGAGDDDADRIARRRTNRSVIDWVAEKVVRLQRELGAADRGALDQYLTHIRELERRIDLVEARNTSGDERAMPEAPSGIPDSWEEHMEIMFDLQLIALQADLTRVISFKTGFDQSNRTFPLSGTNAGFHGASHHGNVPQAILDFNLINKHRLGQMTYFLEKLKTTMEGDSSLLDRTAIVWGSAMGDPNLHNHLRCPLIFMGKANGALEGNIHIRAAAQTPMANAFVSLMHKLGHTDMESFGDSTGELPLSLPRTADSMESGR
jgi:hypothetical protein